MLLNQKVVVVMPAYRAGKTLIKTFENLPHDLIDKVILVDDASDDNTVEISNKLGISTIVHQKNLGYGGNQKTCYKAALDCGADIVVMVHPDYQYEPRLVASMAGMIASGVYDAVIGSRILGQHPISGGMPFYKYVANRLLTFFQNILLNAKLSEYHTGYRAFSKTLLNQIPMENNSNDFIFDNQMLAQVIALNYTIGEISCPTKYFPEASSINFIRSCIYGIGIVKTSFQFRLWKMGALRPKIFNFK
jgi:glycosyltransferase involved in cell wall biosynthesis